ncbi:PhnD/SsuA/transferrin family substrate-binding protein [Mesorhizobium sp. KR9-304]|uniref:phosphate/phosphite/phosphonate ABC transporter substrate-binding protein n=1 Tax=Mesorhizobium sp. KR9-304 TaxID=3156614 RepID=UPI0032B5A54F
MKDIDKIHIAALPMYDWAEARADTDADWRALRARLLAASLDAPEKIVRRNAELPAVPGGIRDRAGRLIAPNPATLPPDELDFPTLWKHPDLLLAQTCWGPMEEGLEKHVTVIGQPSYDGIEGGQGELYSSAILMRRQGQGQPAPADGRAALPLDLFRGRRFAFNSLDSMSGLIALTRDLEAAGESLGIFSERIQTGAHRASIVAVAEGRADVCAVDCRSWRLARRHEPRAADVEVVGWTARRKGLPFITSRHTPAETVAKLRAVVAELASDAQ